MFFVLFASFADAKPAGVKLVKAWKLTQSSSLIGPVNIIVANNGVRLHTDKLGLLWLFKAPEWDAYLYNVDTKNYCFVKYADWKERGFFFHKRRERINALKTLKVKKTGKSKSIANLKVKQVVFLTSSGSKYGEFWVSEKINVPVQFKEVVANMLRIPSETGGTPLKAIIRRKDNKLTSVLETEKAEYVDVSANLFNPQKGYRKVKDEMALLFADSEIFGGGESDTMFGGSDLQEKKK